MRKFAAKQFVSACAGLAMAGFLWSTPASATVSVHIDVSSQTMTVSVNGRYYATWRVSTAAPGYYTPRGRFRAQRLARMHYSSKYGNSPMPHSIFFRGGYAIHGTGYVKSLGRPASHGCVRLAPSNAAQLFNLVKARGAKITITN
jgi:lipoprotein-anchoring transpeptidase ErfK/SrfK